MQSRDTQRALARPTTQNGFIAHFEAWACLRSVEGVQLVLTRAPLAVLSMTDASRALCRSPVREDRGPARRRGQEAAALHRMSRRLVRSRLRLLTNKSCTDSARTSTAARNTSSFALLSPPVLTATDLDPLFFAGQLEDASSCMYCNEAVASLHRPCRLGP